MKSDFKVNVPPEIGALSPGHLQLSGYANRYALSFKTINSLAAGAVRYNKLLPPHAEAARLEILSALTELRSNVDRHGIQGWDNFRQAGLRVGRPGAIYFFSPLFEMMDPNTECMPLTAMHLGPRAINALSQRNIRTVGELVEQAHNGLEGLIACGLSTCSEIYEALNALSKSLTVDSGCDWVAYAHYRASAILPEIHSLEWTPEAFVRRLPSVARTAVRIQFGRDAVHVLEARLLRPLHNQVPLSRVGETLNRTGEKARLNETKIVALFRGIIFGNNYMGCRFSIQNEFGTPVRQLAVELALQGKNVISLAEWERVVADVWRLGADKLRKSERLILEMLGYNSLGQKNCAPNVSRGHVLHMRLRHPVRSVKECDGKHK